MQSPVAQLITLNIDTLLSIAACGVFLRPSVRKNYPWMSSYLCVRAVTAILVNFLRNGPLLSTPEDYTKVFFVVVWTSCLTSAVLLLWAAWTFTGKPCRHYKVWLGWGPPSFAGRPWRRSWLLQLR